MQTIEISDSVYDALMARRVGCEPISSIITRVLQECDECWDAERLDVDADMFMQETKVFKSLDEVLR